MTERRTSSPMRGWPPSPLWHVTHHLTHNLAHAASDTSTAAASAGEEEEALRLDRKREYRPFRSFLIVTLAFFLLGETTGETTGDSGCATAHSLAINATADVIGHFKTDPEGEWDSSHKVSPTELATITSIRPDLHPSIQRTEEMKSDRLSVTSIPLVEIKLGNDKTWIIQRRKEKKPTRNLLLIDGVIPGDGNDAENIMMGRRKSYPSEVAISSSNSDLATGVATPDARGVNEQLQPIISAPQSIWKSKTFRNNKSSFAPTLNETLNIKGNRTSIAEKFRNDETSRDISSSASRLTEGRRGMHRRLSMNTDEALRRSDPSSSSSSPSSLRGSPTHEIPPESSYHHDLSSEGNIKGNINSSLSQTAPSSRPLVRGFHYGPTNITPLKIEANDPKLTYGSLPLKNSPRLGNGKTNRRWRRGSEKGESFYDGKKTGAPLYSLHQSDTQTDIKTDFQVSDVKTFVQKLPLGELSPNEGKAVNISHSTTTRQLISHKEAQIDRSSPSYRHKRKAEMLEVSVMEGGLAELPCDLHVSNPNDSVQLILWIKEGIHTPLYSYDYRELQGGRPKEMKPDVNSTMAQRTSFRTDRSPAALLVERVEADDAGIYRCRADFSLSPTINRRINLTVIVPPRMVKVSWRLEGSGTVDVKDRIAGPFLEDGRPTLICSNDDGWPPSSISWYEDDTLLDDSYTVHFARSMVENEMTLQHLTRGDLGRRLTCLASNSNSTQPATATITIAMTLSILGVKVDEIGRVWAGDKTEVECSVWGSRPPPTIVWWLGPHMRASAESKMMDEGNLTISVLAFTPTPKEDGVMLICQATNDDLPDQAVQDSRLLSVNYAPVVAIRLGPSLDPDRIKEGDDVYFECSVKAKPPVFKVVWKQNGLELSAGTGVFVSNMSLVVQRVTRDHAGHYSCEATNTRDTTTSSPINLDVKYTPICVQAEKSNFAVARRENAIVSCKVDANPINVTFSWTFNNSAEAVHIPNDKFDVVGTESRVSYTPMDEMDYGTLQCRANNTIGTQTLPCIYKIIPAGKPDPPHNCRVSDVTISSLQVNCLPGDDGGLNQTFQLQVFQIGSEKSPIVEVTRPNPSFSVANLRPATPYKIVITAVNNMGPSRIIELKTYTARVPETQQETSAEPTRDRERETGVPLVVLVGGGVVLVPLIVVVAVLVRLKFCRNSGGERNTSGRRSSSHSMDAPSTDLASDASAGVDECDPDILSHTPGVTEPSQWTEVGGDIATLPATLYNPPNGGPVYPTTVGSHVAPSATGHPLGHPTVHSTLHATAIAAPQVPYYTEAHHAQHMGKVAVLSASSFTQGRQQTPGHSIDIQGYPPPPFDLKGTQHPYSPFSHICHSTTGCITQAPPPCSSQYGLAQFQESVAQVPSSDVCPSAHVPQGILQRRGSKRDDSQRSYSTPLSASQMAVSLVKNELIHPPGSCKSPGKGGATTGTLRRQKGKGGSPGSDVRTGGGDGGQPKVESTV